MVKAENLSTGEVTVLSQKAPEDRSRPWVGDGFVAWQAAGKITITSLIGPGGATVSSAGLLGTGVAGDLIGYAQTDNGRSKLFLVKITQSG